MDDNINISLGLIDEFISTISSKKVSKPYYYLLLDFSIFLSKVNKNLYNYDISDVNSFISSINPNSARVFLSAIRQLQDYITINTQDIHEFLIQNKKSTVLRNLKPPRLKKKITKQILTLHEISELYEFLLEKRPELAYSFILFLYFGVRPSEVTVFLNDAKINFDERYMIIKTAKSHNERIIPWSKKMDFYVKFWIDFYESNIKYSARPEEWFSHNIKRYSKILLNFNTTARTCRKCFETYELKIGVPEWKIDLILGHTGKRVGYYYTDPLELLPELRDVMENNHYLFKFKIIQ